MGNKTLETLNSGFRVLRALVFSLSLSLSLPVSVCRQFGTNSLHVFEDTGSTTVMELSRCEPGVRLACLHPDLDFSFFVFSVRTFSLTGKSLLPSFFCSLRECSDWDDDDGAVVFAWWVGVCVCVFGHLL